jgi:bifunctional non-homologous end joining protein LigD
MSKVIESVELRYQEGNSDKVYKASVEEAEDGYVVNFAYGRRGSALNTGTKTQSPVTLEEARKIYAKLVNSKTRKGYQVFTGAGGEAISIAENAGEDTGLRPQLLNPVDGETASAYIRHPDWCVQEKFDGRRMLLRSSAGVITAANRRGRATAAPEGVTEALEPVNRPFVIDGELVGEHYHCFDLLYNRGIDLRSLPYSQRLAMLEGFFGKLESEYFSIVVTACGNTRQRFVEKLRADGKEGVVLKHLLMPWNAGRPASGGNALKLKFWETCSCVVSKVNAQRSVEVALDGRSVGNVTIPPNHAVPEPGQVVEVRYLYVNAEGGSLYQPVYLGVRDDIPVEECTFEMQNLKYKAAA